MTAANLREDPENISRRELVLFGIAAVFVFLNSLALTLHRKDLVEPYMLAASAVWLLLFLASHLVLNRRLPNRDPFVLPIVAILTGWGILSIGRLAPNFLWRQLLWIAFGVALMLLVANGTPHLRLLRRYRYTWLISGLLLLIFTFIFGVNPSGAGAALWLPTPLAAVGRVYFQPSELLKLLLVIFLASYFAERQSQISTDKGGFFVRLPYLAPLLLMWGFCMILLIWQQDLGAASLFFLTFLILLYLASGDLVYVILGTVLLIIAGFVAYYLFDVVALRVNAWMNPWPDASDRAYQIVQSIYALAAGNVAGQGISQGFPEYIPVVHSDFVYASITEEWGLIGGLVVIFLLSVLAYRGYRIACKSERMFPLMLVAGIAVIFSLQSALIIGGITKLLPLTGVTLPFVSYGGSSLIISLIMIGFVLRISDS